MPEIKDSGARREFDSGAVRDIQENKGRCDLMPLDVVGDFVDWVQTDLVDPTNAWRNNGAVLRHLYTFMDTKDIPHLFCALCRFADSQNIDVYSLLLDTAVHYEQGCNKYGERNWERGIPLHSFIDSAARHYLKCLRGDADERHDRAFVWNVLCAAWTLKHRPELDDISIPQ